MGIWWQTGLTPIKPPPPDGPLARHAHRTCQGRAELPRHSIPSAADPRIIFRKPIPICRSAGFGKGLPESRDWPARACFRDLCPKPANFLAYRCRRRPAVPRCHQLRPMSTCQTRDRSEGPQGPIDLIRTSQRLGELRRSQPVPEDSASVHSYPRFFRRVPRPRSAIPHGHGSLQKTSPSPRRSHFDPYSLSPPSILTRSYGDLLDLVDARLQAATQMAQCFVEAPRNRLLKLADALETAGTLDAGDIAEIFNGGKGGIPCNPQPSR